MSEKRVFKMHSGQFHLDQPCSYSYAEHEGCNDEEYENDGYRWQCQEMIDGIQRCDLPAEHPEFREAGYWNLDSHKYLDNVLIKAWHRAFEEFVSKRDPGIGITVTLTGSRSPDEYNFSTDAACFDLTITETALESIRERVFASDAVDVFADYLREYHSSRSGFWSWMPKTLHDWNRKYWRWEGEEIRWEDNDFHRTVWELLDFWLLAFPDLQSSPSLEVFEENSETFREDFNRETEDLRCNGALDACFDFYPGKDAMEHGLYGDPSCDEVVPSAMIAV
jgi:hypothetical protein